MFNIISLQGNQNHNDISLHTYNIVFKKQIINIGEDAEKLKPSYTATGNVNGTATMENNWAVPLVTM